MIFVTVISEDGNTSRLEFNDMDLADLAHNMPPPFKSQRCVVHVNGELYRYLPPSMNEVFK